jgi:biotin transport system substrate-specific component
LAHFVGAGHVLAAGLLPFIPGDLLKLAIAATLLPAGWAILGRHAGGPRA